MQVGDELMLIPTTPGLAAKLSPCRVVYIHPLGRFFTVEFVFKFGSFRESYFFDGRC